MNKPVLWAAAFACTCLSVASLADDRVTISGYMSVVGGKTLDSDERFLADYPNVGEYSDQWTFDPDTLMGLQIVGTLNEDMTVTAQLVARGTDGYSGNIDWLYFSYNLSPEWTLQGGRKRLPMFYYSDFFDIGYAYLWMRPPADTYTWQVFNYNGLNLQYNGTWGNWSVFANVYAGQEDSDPNKLLSDYFFFQPTREIWKNMKGLVFSANLNWFEIRFSHLGADLDRFRSDVKRVEEQEMMYDSLSINLTPGNFSILTEVQHSEYKDRFDPSTGNTTPGGKFDAYLFSIGYRIGEVTPYFVTSKFDDNGDPGAAEIHSTDSFGIRWDFVSSAAFKIQYDKVDDGEFDNGDGTFSPTVAGDSTALTVGIDVVF